MQAKRELRSEGRARLDTARTSTSDMARVYPRKAAQKKLAASGAAKLPYRASIVPSTVTPMKIVNKNSDFGGEWWTRQGLNL
jgi:hypothetical protein